MTSPCRDCEQRDPGCHSTCKGYQEWKAWREKIDAKKRAEKGVSRSLNKKAMKTWVARLKRGR